MEERKLIIERYKCEKATALEYIQHNDDEICLFYLAKCFGMLDILEVGNFYTKEHVAKDKAEIMREYSIKRTAGRRIWQF